MSKQHTPGPWVADNEYGTVVALEDGGYVAEAYDGMKGVDTDREIALANARLIAAAPQLLELLDQLEWINLGNLADQCPSCGGFEPGSNLSLEGHKAGCALAAAIAKAKGVEQ